MLRTRRCAARVLSVVASVAVIIGMVADPATAGLCFTSGKVYVQQKVFDKAARFLECSRREEPDNLQLYALLAFSRNQLRQYRSSGAVYQIGIQFAKEKKDEKRVKELETGRGAALAGLYNKGIAAMGRAGSVTAFTERTTDEATPQAKIEKEKGAPNDFARWSEGGSSHEVWYYLKDAVSCYFPPTGEEPTVIAMKPFTLGADPQTAALDSTIFGDYEGASKVMDAAYNFELAAVIDPTSADVYQNLSYLYELIGRVDDAIAAAKLGLQYRPGDPQITRNMKVAAMGRGNRLYNADKYKDATAAYWQAIQVDPVNRYSYLSRIADSWLREGQRLEAGPDRNVAFDSAGTNFNFLFQNAPAESAAVRQSSVFNLAVIAVQRNDAKSAATWVGEGLKVFPEDLDLLGLAGQVRYQANDFEGAVTALRKAVTYDARNPDHHQFLFLALTRLQRREESAAEYAMFKALSAERKPKTGEVLKKWVDAADNRLGAGNQIKGAVAADGYPDEVYTYSDDGKVFESWFYWSKGKSVTFMEGQVFSKGTFPAQKAD